MSDAQQPFAPVAETAIQDATAITQIGAPINIPSNANFAEDPDVKQQCMDSIYPIITRVKNRRRLLEDEWLAIQRLRTLTHDGGQKYKGRSNVYMPTYATAHNVIVSQLSRGLFPSDQYMDVEANDSSSDDEAQSVKAVIQYEFDCNAKIRQRFKPALSQLVDHGNGVVKYGYRTGKEFVGKKGKGVDPSFKGRPQKGLWISARSLFNVIVYPETAESEDDILITAEYIDIDVNYALALAASKRWKNVEEAINTANVADVSQFSRDQQILDNAKIPGMLENVDGSSNDDNPIARLVTMVECYVSLRLPRAAYVEGEDPNLPIPARVVMFKGIPVEVTRNQNYDQKHPYLWMREGVTPGSFYGSWAGRRARYLQYMINDFANQTNDTGIMGLNPFMVVDTNLLSGPILPMAPGRIYRTRDIKNAIGFNHPPMEPIQYGQQLLSLYINALMDNTGAPPVMQGLKGAETATSSSILQRNSLSPLQDVIEDIEAQVMIPLMERTWRLIVQFTDRAINIVDPMTGMPKQITVDDLDEFEYNFKFLASSQAENREARAQQAIMMLQQIGPNAQLLQMNGYMPNPAEVFRKLWSDYGWRQFDKFMVKLQPPMMGAPGQPGQPGMPQGQPLGGPPQQGAPQGQQQPQVQPLQGPNQNAPIPGGQLQSPQSAGDFTAMRSITDELNSMKGRG